MELKLISISKSYGEIKALNQLSYILTDGVYGLLGPNGAGKSTLMNILTDNLLKDGGEITFNGENVKSMGVNYLKKIGFMPQQQNLYQGFTANRFLFYMASLKGLSRQEAKEQIPRLLSLVNLSKEANKRLGAFSGGMKQRILIAQALLGDPKIIILDEPTAGLDPKERIRIRNLISQVSFNKIVMIATHVVTDIEFIAKEVLLLKKGELVDQGTPLELTDKLQGEVFEIVTTEDQIVNLSKQYKIGNISRDSRGIIVRIISQTVPEDYEFYLVKPTLEDVYLHIFDREDEI